MRLLFYIAIAVAGVGLGGSSAWYSIQQSHGIGAINIGPWMAFPFAGAGEIDPYTVAKAVAEGTVPLGVAEGLALETVTDSGGATLSLSCDYRLEGTTPPSRLWTLVAYDREGQLLVAAPGGSAALFSGNIVRFPDGSFLVSISSRPQPGNWLALEGKGAFRLVLRLYDTPLTGSSGLADPSMPSIRRGNCRP